jgi:hypothetical protein
MDSAYNISLSPSGWCQLTNKAMTDVNRLNSQEDCTMRRFIDTPRACSIQACFKTEMLHDTSCKPCSSGIPML